MSRIKSMLIIIIRILRRKYYIPVISKVSGRRNQYIFPAPGHPFLHTHHSTTLKNKSERKREHTQIVSKIKN
jgi:hypothetical protein